MENILDRTTQLWVKLTGKRLDPVQYQWLLGPIGAPDVIGERFVNDLADKEQLAISQNQPEYGLLESIGQFGLATDEQKKLHPEIIDFYEHTARYEFDFWSSWKGVFRPFGSLLSILFSKRLQQLNLPLNPLDSAKGLESNVIKLKKDGLTHWTVWFRKLKANDRVIYSGVYTTCQPRGTKRPLIKVMFPLPNGNATVLMRITVKEDGSLLLSSDGKRFGDAGFYFLLTDRKGKYWARYVPAMHEWIHVYIDATGTLRTDHHLNFHGMRFLDLHYKMYKQE